MSRDALSDYQGDLAVALSRDTENGIKWLNTLELENFQRTYPTLWNELNRDLKGTP
jgi:hypothetical protein